MKGLQGALALRLFIFAEFFFIVSSGAACASLSGVTSGGPPSGKSPENKILVYEPASILSERMLASGKHEASLSAKEIAPPVAPEQPVPLTSAEREALGKKGLEAIQAGNLSAAALYFEEAERSLGLGERELLGAAILHLERGDLSKALGYSRSLRALLEKRRTRTLDEDLATSPYKEAELVLAQIELKTEQWRDGVARLEHLVRADPHWEIPYLVLAGRYLDMQAPLLAQKVAERALGVLSAPGPDVFILLARALRQGGQIDAAKQTLNQGLARHPLAAGVILWLGVIAYDGGFLTSACERFSLAYERAPELSEAAYNAALCHVRRGEWDRAESVLKLAVAKKPNVPSLRLLYGSVAKHRGNLFLARLAWQDFLHLAPPKDPGRLYVEDALEELAHGKDPAGATSEKDGPRQSQQ